MFNMHVIKIQFPFINGLFFQVLSFHYVLGRVFWIHLFSSCVLHVRPTGLYLIIQMMALD